MTGFHWSMLFLALSAPQAADWDAVPLDPISGESSPNITGSSRALQFQVSGSPHLLTTFVPASCTP